MSKIQAKSIAKAWLTTSAQKKEIAPLPPLADSKIDLAVTEGTVRLCCEA